MLIYFKLNLNIHFFFKSKKNSKNNILKIKKNGLTFFKLTYIKLITNK